MTCSIDKLTILGFLKSNYQFHQYVTSVGNDYVKSYRSVTDTYPYQDQWTFTDGSFMAYAGDTASKVPEIRIEFNPNKCDVAKMFTLMSFVINRRPTRVDIAVDFEDDLSKYLWLCSGKKSCRHYGRNGRLETMYFGKRGSDRMYRIYDKALEQGEKDRVWWRAECQARFGPNDKEYLPADAFAGLYALKPVQEDLADRAMVEYLERWPEQIKFLSRRQRSRLESLGQSVSGIFNVKDSYLAERPQLGKVINLWLDREV